MRNLFFVILIFASMPIQKVDAAVPSQQASTEFLMPSDSIAILRGPLSFCRAERPQKGARSFSYIQFGQGRCPGPTSSSRVGWDRPEDEPMSPGIPFKARGL